MSSSGHPPRLLDQVRNALRRKHYSLRTEEAYIGWVRRFIHFHNLRHPREMGVDKIRAIQRMATMLELSKNDWGIRM